MQNTETSSQKIEKTSRYLHGTVRKMEVRDSLFPSDKNINVKPISIT
jgi:hypothetical protein